MTAAFSGINVLDFCWVAIGPMTTRYLSDFGATVVRIESKKRIDTIRTATPLKNNQPGVNNSAYFANYNSGKQSMALNMGNPEARQIARELVNWADIVTENFTPGIMERWELDYDNLRKIKPDIIMFSASMQGRGGPYSNHPGFGPVLTALSSHTHLTGWPDRVPTSPYGAYTDFLLPRLAVAAIGAALDHKHRTGEGSYLDMSQLEGSLYFVADALMNFSGNGRVDVRSGNEHPVFAPHNAYPCKGSDRWCTIVCTDDDQWKSLCKIMDRKDLIKNPHFADIRSRKENEKELDRILSQWTRRIDAFQVMNLCQESGVPAGVVQTCEDLFEDPQLKDRQHFVFLDHKVIGRHAYDGTCFQLSESPASYSPAPLLGEHTSWVCKEILGMDENKIRELIKAEILV